MTLVVETGSGLSNANAYAAVADVDAFASDRNLTAWAGYSTPVKEAAIISATLYIDANHVFIGSRSSATQALAWPRSGAMDRFEQISIAANVVPLAVKRACMDLAIKVAGGTDILEDLEHGGAVKSETVGPLSVTYKDNSPNNTLYAVTGLLKGLLRPPGIYAPSIQAPSNSADQYFTPDQWNNNGSGPSAGGGG